MMSSLLPGSPDRNLFGRVTSNENVSMPQPGAVQRVNPVNVVLVEQSCEDFGCSVETFGTDIASAVVAMGEESNLMYDSETDVTEADPQLTAVYSENQDY